MANSDRKPAGVDKDAESYLRRLDQGEQLPESGLQRVAARLQIDTLLSARKDAIRRRWALRWLVKFALIAGVVAFILSYARLSWFADTSVDLLVATDYLGFAPQGPGVTSLTQAPVLLSRLDVLDPDVNESGGCIDLARGAGGAKFVAPDAGLLNISLTTPNLPHGSDVVLQNLGDHLRMTFAPGDFAIEEPVDFRWSGAAPAGKPAAGCDSATVHLAASKGGQIELEPYPVRGERIPFDRRLRVSALKLFQDWVSGTDRERVSEISSGTLYIETIAGRKYDLRTGQLLQFDGLKGSILGLSASNAGFKFRFTGSAERIWLGNPAVDITPTLLEYLEAHFRHLWSITASVVAILASLLSLLEVFSSK